MTTLTKPKLIALRGLPASGKTTASRAWVRQAPEKRARVSRDALRDALYYERGVLSQPQEKAITALQEGMARELLRSGKDVVIDDLNLRLQYLKKWQRIAAEEGAEFSVLDTDTPVDKCVKWDKERPEREQVGERFIRETAKRYPKRPELYPIQEFTEHFYVPDESLPKAWLFDIDGTLAKNNSGRSFYDETRVGEDDPVAPVVSVLHGLRMLGARIVVMSGRSMACEIATAEWLDEHVGRDNWDELFMRAEGDKRPDWKVKSELFDEVAKSYAVMGVVDDRSSVVAMWRSRGLTCLQADRGDF